MPQPITVGKLLLKHAVPRAFHQYVTTTELDKKGTTALFNRLAEEAPNEYKDVVSKLTRLGFEISTRMGSTVGLQDLLSPIDKEQKFKDLEIKAEGIRKEFPSDKKKRDQKLLDLYGNFSKQIDSELVDVGVKKNQTLAKVIRSGSRGSAQQYRQTVFSPFLVQDAKGNVLVDFPVKRSFAEGLTLPEYLSATFGARAGEVAKKLAVADAGAFSKELSRASMTIKIEDHDCGTDNGIEVPVTDRDSIGTYLARPVGGFKKNNEVIGRMLNELKNKNIANLIVRSPITCQSSRKFHSGAVCQMCAGRREKGIPAIGDYIGITAASTLGEPLAQGQLNVKHTSGSAGGPSLAGGFDLINQLASIPKHFKNKAAISEKDGRVSEVRKAPQGGYYIVVEGDEYYVPAGFEPKVKVGDIVESGDVLSEGIVNPADMVRLKGVGEGRRYFATTMKKTFDDSGMGGINRRNFELIAKNAIDHVRVTDNNGLGDYLPGEVVHYQVIEKDYQPRPGSSLTRIDQAYNKYLEQPVLHYTIGTRVTHKLIDALKKQGIESVMVHSNPPPFEPEMQRLDSIPVYEPDWMHQLYSTNLERRLINAVNSGAVSSLKGPSPIPGLAYGVGFGMKKAEEEEEVYVDDDPDKLSFE
jgi:DNA-directed RNA polymerase subunit beta'